MVKMNLVILNILVIASIVFSNEKKFYYSKTDSIVVTINDQSNKTKVIKTFQFCFSSDTDSLHTLKFTLWKLQNSDMVFCKLVPDYNYLLKNDIIGKLNDVVIFYLSDKYFNKSWNTYDGFIRLLDYSKRFSGSPFVGLEMKVVTLIKISSKDGTKLYHFEIRGNSDIVEDYVFDEQLNLFQFSFKNELMKEGLSTYYLK